MPTYTVNLHLRSYHTDVKFNQQDFLSKEISAKDLGDYEC